MTEERVEQEEQKELIPTTRMPKEMQLRLRPFLDLYGGMYTTTLDELYEDLRTWLPVQVSNMLETLTGKWVQLPSQPRAAREAVKFFHSQITGERNVSRVKMIKLKEGVSYDGNTMTPLSEASSMRQLLAGKHMELTNQPKEQSTMNTETSAVKKTTHIKPVVAAKKAAPVAEKAAPVAKKAAPVAKKAAPVAKERESGLDDTTKIAMLVKENPHRDGSIQHTVFKLLSQSKTVGDFVKLMAKHKPVNGDGSHTRATQCLRDRVRSKHIKLT